VWKEHGALRYVECVADDVPYGELTCKGRIDCVPGWRSKTVPVS
jgi:uncharacterized protein YbaA (DUF1428 family)